MLDITIPTKNFTMHYYIYNELKNKSIINHIRYRYLLLLIKHKINQQYLYVKMIFVISVEISKIVLGLHYYPITLMGKF
jgi:hypothetical protein